MKKAFILSFIFITIILICAEQCRSEDLSKYMFRPEAISLSECEKIKDEYGISVCTVDGDYWVGAAKACGGVSNLPSGTDFYRISNNILDRMIYNYDPSLFTNKYYTVSNYYFYTDEPYQKKEVNQNANWLVKKWQTWRYNVNFNKIHGYKLSINKYYTTPSDLYSLERQYDDYVKEETRRVTEWNKQYPDDPKELKLQSRYDYMKSKIGSYTQKSLFRDNYDLNAYCICKSDLLR